MVYKQITIKNFRGIKSIELNNLSRINLLLGKNSVGKSSILEAIFLLTGSDNPNLLLSIDLFRNIIHNSAEDFAFVFNNLNYSNSPEISAILNNNNDSTRDLNIKPSFSIGESTQNNSKFSTDTLIESQVNSIDLITAIKTKHSQKITQKSSISIGKNIDGTINFNINRDLKAKPFIGALFDSTVNNSSADLFSRLNSLIVDKKKDDLIKSLKSINKEIVDINLGAGNMVYVDLGIKFKKLVPLNLLGDGAIKITKIILNLNHIKNGVLLIDEIENGLHYTILDEIWNTIIQLSEKLNVQLFVTTHSKEAIESLNRCINKLESTKGKDLISCYTINKNSENEMLASYYNVSSFKEIVNGNFEIRGE